MFEPIYHGMTVARLRQLLADVRDDVIIMPNDLRNLTLLLPMKAGDFGYLGQALKVLLRETVPTCISYAGLRASLLQRNPSPFDESGDSVSSLKDGNCERVFKRTVRVQS